MLEKIVLVFSLSLIAALSLVVFFFVRDEDIAKSDLPSFLTGAQIIRDGQGHNLYNLKLQIDTQKKVVGEIKKELFLPFRSLPFVALLFVPFTLLPLIVSYKLFAVINIFFLALNALLFMNLARKRQNRLFFLIVPFLFAANLNALFYGQISIFLNLVLFLVYKFMKEKREFTAGGVLAIFLIKPQYLVFLPFLFVILNQKKVFLKGFLGMSTVILFASLFIAGPDFIRSYVNLLAQTENLSYGTNIAEMFSLTSAVLYLSPQGLRTLSIWVWLLVGIYLTALWFFDKQAKRRSLEANFVVVSLASVVFAPHVFVHGLSLLTTPLYLLWNGEVKDVRQRNLKLILSFLVFLAPATTFWRGSSLVLLNSLLLSLCLWIAFHIKR